MHRAIPVLFLLLLICLTTACKSAQPIATIPDAPTTQPGRSISVKELDELTYAYADSYVTRMATALDRIAVENQDPVIRVRAGSLKVVSATNMYDIVTSAEPTTRVQDIMVSVGLQKVFWIDEKKAQKVYGDQAQYLIDAVQQNYDQAESLCRQILKPQRVDRLNESIAAWRVANPNVQTVGMTRLADIASQRGSTLATEQAEDDGLLAPLNDATKQIDESRKLAERAFFLSKRMPLIVAWQSDDAVNRVLVKAETQSALKAFTSVADSLQRLTVQVEKAPGLIDQERDTLLAEIDKRHASIDATLSKVQAAEDSGQKLLTESTGVMENLKSILATTDQVVARFDNPGPTRLMAKPFDVNDYTKTIVEVNSGLKEGDRILTSAESLLNSKAWTERLEQVNAAADERVRHAASVTKDVAIFVAGLAVGLIVFAFVCLIFYRHYTLRLLAKHNMKSHV